jgi:hypothetical protein
MPKTRTRIEQTADDLLSALYDEALTQCEERNPHAVALLVNEANRIGRAVRTINRVTGKAN